MSEAHDSVDLDSIPARTPDIVPRKIAGDTILVPVRGELAEMQQLFVLDEVAEFVWGELNGSRPVSEIVAGVVAGFDVDEETASADVIEFLAELCEVGLVVLDGGADDNG
jgi:hypothetical protein